MLTVRYSDIAGGQAGILVEAGSILAFGPGTLDVDLLFSDVLTDDYHLTLGSPVRDAGDPVFFPWVAKFDIDGEPRFFAPRLDMGSDEVNELRRAR